MRRARHMKVRASLEEDISVMWDCNEESVRPRQCLLAPIWASEMFISALWYRPDLGSKNKYQATFTYSGQENYV